MNRIFTLALLPFFFACQAPEKKQKPEDPFKQLTKHVDYYSGDIVAQGNMNSMSVAVYCHGKTYHSYYGEMTTDGNDLPNDQSLFEIASISKIFLGSLVAEAVEKNDISLEDDIRDYLPRDYPNLEYEGTPVRIKDLVTHTLGFETPPGIDRVYDSIFSGNYDPETVAYNMDDLFQELAVVELHHAPGTYYDYSNVGPEIAAYILEHVYKRSYRDQLQDLLEEVGMENTYLQDYGKHQDHLVMGYTEEGEPATTDENPLLGGASGMITTLPDLAKFMKYQLESNEPLIKESTTVLFDDEEQDETVGYFWDLGFAEEEGFYYFKSGTSNGTQSIMLICPDSNYGQILIMNNTSDEASRDWLSLYGRIEYDLIKYPKINLWATLEPTFLENPEGATKTYLELMKDTATYITDSEHLNNVAYSFLFRNELEMGIEVLKLAVAADPENANLYDSLGEAYYMAKNYEESLTNFETSLRLNPANQNAEKYMEEIRGMSDN
ncbi:MAG: serine hydrolase [Bacteroidota bacterium]